MDREPNAATPYNVVLVTFDGVRWQEFFGGTDPLQVDEPQPSFPLFWARLARRGATYGDPRANGEVRIANAAGASLPGYTSIYAEEPQGCVTNLCERIRVPTFVDRLHDELAIPREKLAVMASWKHMPRAVSSRDEVAMVRAFTPLEWPEAQDPQAALLGETLEFDRPTVLRALRYLRDEKPRFLHLALLDSDRFGHAGRYAAYAESLRAYDRVLDALVSALDGMSDYGPRTALIVTTDHGRGTWEQWSEHGPHVPSSHRVWAFAALPPAAKEFRLAQGKDAAFTHHDVRVFIERMLGLGVRRCAQCPRGFLDEGVAP